MKLDDVYYRIAQNFNRKSVTNFDNWQSIRQIFPTNLSSQCISHESYHQFAKVLLIKVS